MINSIVFEEERGGDLLRADIKGENLDQSLKSSDVLSLLVKIYDFVRINQEQKFVADEKAQQLAIQTAAQISEMTNNRWFSIKDLIKKVPKDTISEKALQNSLYQLKVFDLVKTRNSKKDKMVIEYKITLMINDRINILTEQKQELELKLKMLSNEIEELKNAKVEKVD